MDNYDNTQKDRYNEEIINESFENYLEEFNNIIYDRE